MKTLWELFFATAYLCSSIVEGAQLQVVEIQPCSITSGTVSDGYSITYAVHANFSLCNSYDMNGYYALRVSTWSIKANSVFPLVFVTRQREAVDSWTLPYHPPEFYATFDRVNRTLCQHNATDADGLLVYMDVFTSHSENVTFSIVFDPVANYTLREKTWYPVVVGAATPQVRLFQFPDGVETVTVQAEASNKRCALLSVQNVTCPVNDLLADVKYRGHYQTMSTDGFLTVTRKSLSNSSFLLVLITTNYTECHSSDYVPQIPVVVNGTDAFWEFDQTIKVKISPLEAVQVGAIILPVVIFICFYILAPFLVLEECFVWRWSPFCKWKFKRYRVFTSDSEIAFSERLNNTDTPPNSYGSTERGSTDAHEDSLELSVMNESERDIRLPRMCKTHYRDLQSQYSVYSWNTVTVGIFYSLPAFQLVFSQQLLANSSGEEDLCYYNFKCANPLDVINSFNNVWSNVGYVMLGILFVIITFIRKTMYTARRKRNIQYYDNHGVPQFYGIYYAMGLSLVMEGIMSSLYHVCPTNANFQFDTAFMFIIAGLLLTKVFQNRHPDIHTNAFIAFFSFAVVIFFTLLGIYYDRSNPVTVRCTLLAVVLIMVAGFFLSFYYFHRWQLSKEMFMTILNSFKIYFTTKPSSWTLLHRIRFLKLLFAFSINAIIAVVAVAAYEKLDIATTILTFFLVNVLYFLAAYVITKIWYREPWTLLPMVLPLIIGLLWGVALYFFLSIVSSWQLTPAESRALNRPCVLMGFYDNHDIWHFLSACALFLSFLFIMTLDDGIADWERKEVQVF